MIMRTLTSVVAACVGVLVIQSAQATLLFSEAFNYDAAVGLGGQVNPGNNTAWSSAASGLSIGSGNLTYSGLPDQGGNELSIVNGSATTSINTYANQTSGQVYYSFLLDVITTNASNAYITSLNPGTTPPGGSADALAVYLYQNNTLGIRTAGASTTHPATLSLDTTYFVVVDYDFTANTGSGGVNLWLNPVPGGSQPAPTASLAGNGSVTAIDDVGFKAQSTASGNFLIDNLLIGTTWADVTPTPEPSTLALAGLGMLGLVLARRKRH
jgi:PEP-CTERM motif